MNKRILCQIYIALIFENLKLSIINIVKGKIVKKKQKDFNKV